MYIGLVLNATTLLGRITAFLSTPTLPSIVAALGEPAATTLIAFLLLRLIGLGGDWCWKVMATALTLISVAASYYMTFFNVVIGYGIVASLFTTDIDLSKDVVGVQFLGWVVVMGGIPAALVWRTTAHGGLRQQLQDPWRALRGACTVMACVLVAWAPLRFVQNESKQEETRTNRDMPSYGGVFAHSYLPTNWVSALVMYSWTQASEYFSEQVLINPLDKHLFVAPSGLDNTYVVFIIGETTRWDHMGVMGYSRDTTPNLARETNLVTFAGESCDTATRLSLRCMFVRKGAAQDNEGRTTTEHNVFTVMDSLGFSSELFSMQSEVWFYRSGGFDDITVREQIGSARNNRGLPVDDMLLVPELRASIARHPAGKHLIVLHTKGSHYLYSQRHPRSFARYKPECLSVDAFCTREQLVNSFDNSIGYTDHFLSQVFDSLRDKDAIVFFASDHGESIEENTSFHATPRSLAPPEQFRSAMTVWASERFLEDPGNRIRFESLSRRREEGRAMPHEELFDTVLGCLGYSSPDGGISALNNWCHVDSAMSTTRGGAATMNVVDFDTVH